MKRTLQYLVFGSLMLASSGALRAEISARAWMETYYLAPTPERIPHAIRELGHGGYFERRENLAVAIGFFGTLFARHADHVEGWLRQLDHLPPSHQRLIAAILWQAGDPKAEDLLRALARQTGTSARIERIANLPSQRIVDTPVASPSSIRLQWGAFLATGDERHIVSLLETLGVGEPALGAAARMALAQYAADHPRVMEICRAQLQRQPEEIRAEIRAVLAQASAGPAS